MTDVHAKRVHPAVALIAAFTAFLVTTGAAASVPALTVDDIAALLEAGVGENVILKQVNLSGTRLVLTVDMLIRLKTAGASDELLEALVSSPAPEVSSQAEPLPVPRQIVEGQVVHASFRVYSEVDESGEAVVTITNLDASGRRIGGEVERPVPANVVQPSESPARDDRRDYDTRSYDDDQGQQGQVVVNVYPPADSGSASAPARESYELDPYDRYGRYTPVYYGLGRRNHHFHSPTCGHPYYYYGYPAYYPGYHRKSFHHRRPGPGIGLGSIRTVPYSFNSSAAARNRKAFGRR